VSAEFAAKLTADGCDHHCGWSPRHMSYHLLLQQFVVNSFATRVAATMQT
jgi:hypothetical protein